MIYFVGAGSGAPDLITVRGMRLLQKADVIIYAGSLVNPQLLDYAKEGCEIHNIKLMAYAGLLLGAKNIVFAFILACILGSVIHTIRMKVSKRNNLLALGPYLSAGIFIAALWGSRFWTWYLGMMGIY